LNRKLVLTLFLIVFLPLVLLLWMGQRVARTERDRIEQRFDALMRERLTDIDEQIQRVLAEHREDLLEITNDLPENPDALRTVTRQNARLASVFRLSPTGELQYPVEAPDRPLTEPERGFLRRTGMVWLDRQLSRLADSSGDGIETVSRESGPSDMSWGWHAWHFEHGLHVLFWRRLDSGAIVGAELNRVRFMSDLIATLPETPPSPYVDEGRIVLSSADGDIIYQWGSFDSDPPQPPRVSIPASPPLESWRLAWHGAPATGWGGVDSAGLGLAAGIASFAVALGLLAFYFYRESTRELREAGQRVNFVGQVSHELKTPLTNIRMYAELLENELDESETEARKDLDVIVSESRRLSRLIGNILTFSRKDRGGLKLRRTRGDLDVAVRDTVEHFRPLIESKGVHITLDLSTPDEIPFDRDVVEQILGNLLSNVEKYAASGEQLTIATRHENGGSIITVADEGPGVPRAEREKIFEPFYRVSDRLTDGVAGTGLGLSLSRELARLHGGDLKLLDSDTGARFEVTLGHGATTEAPPS